MTDAIVTLDNVSRFYSGGRIKALSDVSLHILRGDSVAITGPSGSGKSTLLNIISGLDRPTDGRAMFEGKAPCSANSWARLRAEKIGIIFQSFNLLPTFTALENVEAPMFGVIKGGGSRRKKAKELLKKMGLSERMNHLPGDLSGGERQRTAIARSLANDPSLLLADEPTGNLDSQTAASILALLNEIHIEKKVTLIIVTHDKEIASVATRKIEMIDGRIV